VRPSPGTGGAESGFEGEVLPYHFANRAVTIGRKIGIEGFGT